MSVYLALKLLHVLSAVVLLGGFALLALADVRSGRDSSETRAFAALLDRAALLVLAPALVALFLTGATLASGAFEIEDGRGGWIPAGMALWALLAAAFALAALALAGLADPARAGPRLAGVLRFAAWLGMVAGAAAVLVMEVKPW